LSTSIQKESFTQPGVRGDTLKLAAQTFDVSVFCVHFQHI